MKSIKMTLMTMEEKKDMTEKQRNSTKILQKVKRKNRKTRKI